MKKISKEIENRVGFNNSLSAGSLIIDEEAKTKIAELVQHCVEFPISYRILEAMVEGKIPPIGDSPDHVIHLFNGFRIAFSWEVQSDSITYRHISISLAIYLGVIILSGTLFLPHNISNSLLNNFTISLILE